jgi:multiple sugar transport system substrate-binding protein
MTGSANRSPNPSEVGFSLMSRRQVLVAGAGAVGASAVLAACGSDTATEAPAASGAAETPESAPASAAPASEAPAVTEAAEPAADGVTFGSNYSDPKPVEAMAAAIAATGVPTAINTVDHNSYQENFNTYIQDPDDVVCWFAGYRMRAFAGKGVVGDISDVWGKLEGMSEGFKNASTGNDGKQYFVPFYFYPWAVHYKKSLFAEKGYEAPKNWTELLALCEKMKADGITPFAAANDGKWPQMGMFDMINMRTNGYDFHVSLMAGKESWTDPKVAKVFENWSTITGYYQPDVNGRTWQDAATAFGAGETGMYLLGTFVASNFDPKTDPNAQAIIDDLDFFAFPEIDPAYGQDAVEAPIDGFMMAANPKDPEGAKALLAGLGGAAAIDGYISVDPSVVAATSGAATGGYNYLQKRSAELVGAAKYISQFLDRDTDPDFASNVVGQAIADFLADGTQIESILKTVDEQAKTYTFE